MGEMCVGQQLRCPKCNQYHPDRCTCNKPDKGEKGGSCNRVACQQPGANHFNYSTQKYYCETCAEMLNDYNRKESMELFGHDLCLKADGRG